MRKLPRILLADDSAEFRRGVRALLEEYGMLVVGEAVDGLQALELAITLRPDVVLMDVRMRGLGGVETARLIHARLPGCRVVLLSAFDDDRGLDRLEDGSVFRYLVKGSQPVVIRDAILDAWSSAMKAAAEGTGSGGGSDATTGLEPVPPSAPVVMGGAVRSGPLSPRVLVVDDEEQLLTSLCEMLHDLGFQVVGGINNGMEAVERVVELDPDVVLMDIRMPGLDGIEATRLIKEIDPTIEVVMLSAYEDLGFRQGAESSGAYCYLVKGCSPGLIGEMLHAAARHRREVAAVQHVRH